MKKMKLKLKLKKKNLIILIIVGILLLGGIGFGVAKIFSGNDKTVAAKVDKKSKKKEEKIPEPEVQIVDVNSKTRPFAVMINNLGVARPYHTGLQEAYMVYEIVVEGGITRYLALFKDVYPEAVGSVRSARHYFLDYVLENDAFYVHWGWSPQAKSDISSLGVENFNGLYIGQPYFFRNYDLPVASEHTGFANLSAFKDYVEGKRTETDKGLLLDYSATNVDLGSDAKDATNIDLTYSYGFATNYVYDSSANVYKQFVNNVEHTDYETKEQYTVKNIITYKVGNANIAGDAKGRQTIDNIGSGEGYFITGGKAVEITWEKSSRSAKTVYKYKNGEEIKVNDGNTWIHIVPNDGSIDIS